MKMKTEFLVLGVIIVAAAAYLMFHDTDQEHYQLPVLPKIDTAAVTRIDIQGEGKKISLEKKGDTWVIQPGGFPADGARVKGMLFTFEDLTFTALVSESKSYGRYDLSADKRITVSARAGEKELRAFDIGKEAPTFQHTFVKLPDDDRVFHAQGDFRRKFDHSVDDLRDKIIMSFIPETISAIEISDAGRTLVLKKSATESGTADSKSPVPATWTMEDGKTVDPQTVDNFMDRLNRMECQTFLTDRSPQDFKDPAFEVVLVGDDRKRFSVYTGSIGEEKHRPATSSQNSYAFAVAGWQVENLTDLVKEWTKEKKEPVPKGTASST